MIPKRNLWIYSFLLVGFILIGANSCTKDDSNPQNGDTGTVIDWDKNVYHTVVIDKQTWMVENLKTTHYNNGAEIHKVPDNLEWSSLKTPAYCWYKNDSVAYKETYGALYNGYIVNSPNFCPAGWHVPTIEEWDALIAFLGGEAVAGGKLKEKGKTHWFDNNTEADNSTGFTALPGGSLYGYQFIGINTYGNWWSSTTDDKSWMKWECTMSSNNSSVSRGNNAYFGNNLGLSVRCIKGAAPAR